MSLLPVEEAIRRVLAGAAPLPSEMVSLDQAHGRILSGPLVARRSHPPFDASAMDGYAVRAADTETGARLRVIGTAAAGHGFAGSVSPGEAVRIFTGAPLPPGADSVLIQENADRLDQTTVAVRHPVTRGRNVRTAAFDFMAGTAVLDAGRRLGPRELSLAAAMGHGVVPVNRRPRATLIATGDELVPPGADAGPSQIVASNGIGVAALIAEAGGKARDLGIVRDDREALRIALDVAFADAPDVLVMMGGASVGDHDLVAEALKSAGVSLDFWRIALRPGKPLMFGRRGATFVFGLPGNPVSALVCSLLFLRPLIALLGGRPYNDPTEPAILAVDVPANDERQDYIRATIAPGAPVPAVTPLPLQDSAMLSALASADCLLIRAPDAPAASAGASCRIIRLS